MDNIKWMVVILLSGAAIGGNFYFEDFQCRAIGVVISIIVALSVASTTERGRTIVTFAKESRIEVRKVVWPSRQEAVQTTAIVMVATLIMVLLWGLDGIIVRVVSFVTEIGI